MAKVIHQFGDDISTDIIYPGRFMATVLPNETPAYAFADELELNAKLKNQEFPAGSVIVAGNNFGCGSSREQAASAVKGYELTMMAKGFARIFLQNAINLGLNLVVAPELEAKVGDDLEVKGDTVFNHTSGRSFKIEPLPQARQAIIDAGGLIAYTRKKLLEKVK